MSAEKMSAEKMSAEKMSTEKILFNLRRFLFAFSGFLFLGTLVELSFSDHTQEPVQLIPFVLCVLGVLAVTLAWFRPQRKVLLALQASMGFVILGSLVGLYEHNQNNIGFQVEIHPDSSPAQLLSAALGGASPLLAPCILAVAALLALAATYYHPALHLEEAHIALIHEKPPDTVDLGVTR